MALFGKKTNTTAAAPEPAPAPVDDFSPEALAALAASLESGTAAAGGSALQVRKPVSFKNGTIVGLNIGAHSIKAVELTVKSGSCAVTAMAMAPTPPDSIANGVVMSVNVLGEAVKELITHNGFKARKAVTSVAGTGEVIVRVIEVPNMTDAELAENMKTDLDRYIPFPPSEVQWDAAGMRDLPMDANAANMDVLLVAARHELIDLHLQLLASAKLDPRAIDVEPLAAARALTGPLAPGSNGHIDYNDVCAVLNIGASSTEISILRGDELVFTRTVPMAGNMMTQALMDHLNLTHQDAEQLKIQLGDALPLSNAAPNIESETTTSHPEATPAVPDIFDTTDVEPEAHPAATAPPAETDAPLPGAPHAPEPATTESADPFDLDLFNQGPTQNEPDEQHQQKMPDPPAGNDDSTSNLPSRKPDVSQEGPVEDDDTSLPSKESTPTPAPEPAAPGGAIASFFDFGGDELDEHSEQLPTIEGQPQHTEAPPREDDDTHAAVGGIGAINEDDDSFLPSMATSPGSEDTLPSAFTFPGEETTPSPTPAPTTEAGTPPAQPSGFAFGSPPVAETPAPEKSTPPAAAAAGALGAAGTMGSSAPVVEAAAAAPLEEIDLSDILGDAPAETPQLAADEGLGAPIDLTGAAAIDTGLGESFDDLGTGLDGGEKAPDAQTVYAVLKPLLDDLSGELRRSLEYHSARYADAPVTRLVLIGGGAKMRNLDAYFAQNLGLPTSLGNPLQHLKIEAPQITPPFLGEHGSSFVIALGLAMRELIR